jgi:hypothetical protein
MARVVFEEDLSEQRSAANSGVAPSDAPIFEEDLDPAAPQRDGSYADLMARMGPETELDQYLPFSQENQESAMGAAKAAVAMAPDLVGIPFAGAVGLGTAAIAALDQDPITLPGDAFNAGMEHAAEGFYNMVTQNILEAGPGDYGDEAASAIYERVGEAFDYGLSAFGQGIADYGGRKIAKPVLELFGHEWQPEDEAFWYSLGKGGLAAFAMAYPFKGSLGKIGREHLGGPTKIPEAGEGLVHARPKAPEKQPKISRNDLFKEALEQTADEVVTQGIARQQWDLAATDPNVRDLHYINFDNPLPADSLFRQYQVRQADVYAAEAAVKAAKGKKQKILPSSRS